MAVKGLDFITQVTFSTASSVEIDNAFSATYDFYHIIMQAKGGPCRVDMRLRASGVNDAGANYSRQFEQPSDTTVGLGRLTGDNQANSGVGNAYDTTLQANQVLMVNPYAAIPTKWWMWQNNSIYAVDTMRFNSTMYVHSLSTSYDGFTAIPSAGTITGAITIWGYVK